LAYVHAALGRNDRAFELLDRAIAERSPGILWLKVDPRVESLRGDRRFNTLIDRLGLEP